MVRARRLFRFRSMRRFPLGRTRLTIQQGIALFVAVFFIGSIIGLVYQTRKVSAAYTCLNGGDHGGANWDPATDCPGGIAGNHTNIGTLTINAGETATVQAYNGSSFGSVQISAATVSILGTLTANSAGFPQGTGTGAGVNGQSGSGGSYGGLAGIGNNGATVGPVYGAYLAPVSMGSGGGAGQGSGGAGGGAIKITATGTLTISGTITSNGGTGSGCSPGGGGSGGSIYLTAGTLAGSGSVSANGGNGIGGCQPSGSGGGGRIAMYYSSSSTFGNSITAAGGSGGNANGQPGTAVIIDSTNNDLYLETSQTWSANPSLEGGTHSYRNVYVQGNSTLTTEGYYTTNTNGVGLVFSVTNFQIDSGSTINGNGMGYGAQAGPGAGSTGGGAGYGGAGGAGASGGSGAGAAYGSYSAPVDLGSGGGNGSGGAGAAGGGALRVNATGTITINGTITMNGSTGSGCSPGGGGSGGSVYLTAGTLAGLGSISANGGGGNTSCLTSGAGSGGRIMLSYTSGNTFGHSFSITSGTVGNAAQTGTALLLNAANDDMYVETSQTWSANPSLEGGLFKHHSLTIENNSTLTLASYSTTSYNGVGFTFSVYNFTIASGSTLTSSGTGYAGGTGTANGSGPGGGTGSGGAGGAGGGAYGGTGGNGNTGITGGSSYGLAMQPTDLGSGGGAQNGVKGGAGGGAIRINANGAVNISGSLTANGNNSSASGGGGSGGAIFIIAGTFTGGGTITANGGNGASLGGGGSGGRVAISYDSAYSWTGTALDAAHSAVGGTGSNAGSSGTVQIIHHALLDRAVTMSNSGPGATPVSYDVSIKSASSTTIGGIVVDACDDTPIFGAATCAYPSGFNWGGATPGLTINGGMGSGWTASGVQGGAGTGQSQVVELSNTTPQSVSPSTPIDFTITTVTNPTSVNHSFYIRVITFNTAGNMTSEYTVSGTTRSGNLPDSLDHGGMALSTGQGISLSFEVPETLTFCVSKVTISNCTSTTPPNIVLGHSVGGQTFLTSTAVDTTSIFTQTSTNAQYGAAVTIKNVNPSATCGGLSVNNGSSCSIPAVNTSCGGSCSATTITAGNAAIGLCVAPGTGNITASAPYNGASCGAGGNTYGLDDATVTNVRSTYGSQIFSSSGPLNGENDTLVFAATASNTSTAGAYSVTYALIATATF